MRLPQGFRSSHCYKRQVKDFFRRRPDIRCYKPAKHERSRALADLDAQTICGHYLELARLIQARQITKETIWSVDETGIDLDNKRTPVHGHHSIRPSVQSDSEPHVSVVACVSAGGDVIPPQLIFSAKKSLRGDLMDNVKDSCYVSVSEKGFMNGVLWRGWMKLFVRHVDSMRLAAVKAAVGERARTKALRQPHLLVLDGLLAHFDPEALDMAKAANIEVFFIPPHTSHRTQPLDTCAFSVYKTKLRTNISAAMLTLHIDEKLPKNRLAGIIVTTYFESMTTPVIEASFRTSGTWPVDGNRVLAQLPLAPYV